MLARAVLAQPTGGATLPWFELPVRMLAVGACERTATASTVKATRTTSVRGCVSGGEIAERTADQPASLLSEPSRRQREPPTHRAQPSSGLMRRQVIDIAAA